jgi:hypothetical protein
MALRITGSKQGNTAMPTTVASKGQVAIPKPVLPGPG